MISKRRQIFSRFHALLSNIFSWENVLALIIALILIAIYIATAADTPIWLYQGF